MEECCTKKKLVLEVAILSEAIFYVTFTTWYASCLNVERMIWTKTRGDFWWNKTVSKAFSNSDWLDNFRMSHQNFVYICNEIREDTKARY